MEPTPDSTAPAAWARTPRIRSLSALQSTFVLSRNHVGRLAFLCGGRLELLPVHYVFADGRLVGRTSFHGWTSPDDATSEIVFEVDEAPGLFEWRSVIVRGTMRMITAPPAGADRDAYWSAVVAFRELVPDAFTERDPTPARRIVFAIEPTEITGREASMSFFSRPRPATTKERSHGDYL